MLRAQFFLPSPFQLAVGGIPDGRGLSLACSPGRPSLTKEEGREVRRVRPLRSGACSEYIPKSTCDGLSVRPRRQHENGRRQWHCQLPYSERANFANGGLFPENEFGERRRRRRGRRMYARRAAEILRRRLSGWRTFFPLGHPIAALSPESQKKRTGVLGMMGS